MSSAPMAAPIRSIARSPCRPARSIRSGVRISPTPIPPKRSGRFRNGRDPQRIVSLDPWGHLAAENFATEITEGIDIRPSIAITRARLDLPELQAAIEAGRLKHDGEVVHKNGSVSVVKIAIDPVWYLPGLARALRDHRKQFAPAIVRADRGHVSGTGDAAGPAGVSAADRRHDGLSVRRRQQTAGPHAPR